MAAYRRVSGASNCATVATNCVHAAAVFFGAVLTQDLKWQGGAMRTEIGDHNTFREYVSIHSATSDGGVTVVGSHNRVLAYSHIAHDCRSAATSSTLC